MRLGRRKKTKAASTAVVRSGVLKIGSLSSGTYFKLDCADLEIGEAIDYRRKTNTEELHFIFSYAKGYEDRFKIQVVDALAQEKVIVVVRSDVPFTSWGQNLTIKWKLVAEKDLGKYGHRWDKEDKEIYNYCDGLVQPKVDEAKPLSRTHYIPGSFHSHHSERKIMNHWASFAGISCCEEYKKANTLVCISPSIWSTSGMSKALEVIEKEYPSNVSMKTVCAAVKNILNNKRNYSSIFERMKPGIGFRAAFVNKVLLVLVNKDKNSPDALRLLITEIERQVGACDSRRVSLFDQLLESASRTLIEKQLTTPKSEIEKITGSVLQEITQFVEDLKLRAFKEVFIIPALVYFDKIYDHTGYGDVEVHGANVYSAVLLSTLGVRIGRPLFLSDEAKACPDFLGNVEYNNSLLKLWAGSGPSEERITERKMQTQVRQLRIHRVGVFSTGHGRTNPYEIANAAVDSRADKVRPNKRALATYLEAFASYFEEKKFVTACITSLTSNFSESTLNKYLKHTYGLQTGKSAYEYFWEMNEEDLTKVDLKFSLASNFLKDLGIKK